jgi:hypothetical protein
VKGLDSPFFVIYILRVGTKERVMNIPKYTSLPRFSDDPVQNAERTMEYYAECRYLGVNPHYAGDTDDDEYDPDAYDGEEDYDEFSPEPDVEDDDD